MVHKTPTPKMVFSRQFWKIDRHLLPLKCHYFLFFAALSCVLPFRTVFAKQLGVSAMGVGVIFLAVPFLKILTNPLFGFVVDYFKKFRSTLSLAVILVSVSHLTMLFIPSLDKLEEFKTSDIQVFLKLDCFEGTMYNDTYIQVYSQVQFKRKDEFGDIVCDITCSSYTSNMDECDNNMTLKSTLTLKGSPCHLEHTFSEDSILFIKNTSMRLLQVRERSLNYGEYFKAGKNQNCSNYGYLNSETKTVNGDPKFKNLGLTLPEETHSSKSRSQEFHKLKTHELFETSNDAIDQSCFFKKWLPCNVNKCNSSRTQEVDVAPPDEFLSSTFWLVFTLTGIGSACMAAVCFMVDAVCYEIMDDNEKYGENRLWGTVGWGLGAFAGGYLNQIIVTEDSTTDYSLSFYLLAVLGVIDLIPVYHMRVENVKYSPQICKDVCFIFTKPQIVINTVVAFAIGVLSGLIWNYQFWFMEEIGSSQVLLGLSQVFECLLSELPCFMISGWVIRKIGYANCNSLTFLLFGVRYLFFAYMENPWMTLPVGLLYGPTFGIFFAALTMYAKTEAPPGTEATVQSILQVAFEGVGCGTGSILGGIGFETLGSRGTFFYTGIASFILLAVNVLLHIFVLRPQEKPPPEKKIQHIDVISHL